MALGLSKRAARITQAEIRVMTIECEKAGGINLAQGVCDTETPLPVRRGAQAAIEEGVNSYTRFDGLAELRQAIASKLRASSGIIADPETEITVSAGSTGAFYCACLALLDPGDEVILFEPFYGYHLNTIEAVGAVAGFVRTHPPDWSFDARELEAAITPRTRGIMVNTPGNPSGKVYTRAELELIARVAERHDLFVFTDEIYEHFLYDGRPHLSPAALPELKERTIAISGFSKTYSITGWRIGYSVAPRRFAEIIGHMNDLIYVCAPAPLQLGVARGVAELGADYYEALTVEYTAKRERICRALDGAGLTPHIPQGAYYVLADTSRLPGATGKARAMHLLQRAGVASVPGEAFYHDDHGHNLARFCFAKHDDELDEACRRLARLD
ncbi:MAG TPA: pyridoxal phosphate-dependent aminotransferase [Candidatus Binataceae bacterium]|nr:pyridoxal phosphate-dependent aminotransferase [Candidatus Binataceae bacterium]